MDALAEKESEIAGRLEELRRAHGLTQESAAPKVGVSLRQWQRWEAGESEPRASNLKRIAEGFGISIAELADARSEQSQLDRIEALVADIHRALLGTVRTDGDAEIAGEAGVVAEVVARLEESAGSPPKKAHGRSRNPPATRVRKSA